MDLASNGRWSTLIEPSIKSDDTFQVNACRPQKSAFTDRLRAFFYVNVSKSQQPKARKKHTQSTMLQGLKDDFNPSSWPSPWILPVNVVSSRRDAEEHAITKIAKCTIDTGNMQGNIVSRDFVENVLEFPESSFEDLTKEEKMGGTGITGDSHIPQGAIYLTWYHKSSTRVFRDMRFLISPTQHCDLIIGARSIQKENILSVPCLVTLLPKSDTPIDQTKTDLENALKKKTDDLGTKERRKNEFELGGKKDTRGRLAALQKDIPLLRDEVHLLTWTIEIWDIVHHPVQKGTSIVQKQALADPIWKNIQATFISDDLQSQELPELWKQLRENLQYDVVSIPEVDFTYASGSAS